MLTTVFIRQSIPQISYFSRSLKDGPEKELVYNFLDRIKEKIIRKGNLSTAVFIEPKLDIGFPDLVFVRFDHRNFSGWNQERLSLSTDSLKILSYLHGINGISLEQIANDLGYNNRVVEKHVNQLIKGNVVRKKGNKYFPYKKQFGVKEIIAIECKMSASTRVVSQATNNNWFASRSYILTPVIDPKTEIISSCQQEGIGVLGLRGQALKKILPPLKRTHSVTYVSLLFNEWIGRYLAIAEEDWKDGITK